MYEPVSDGARDPRATPGTARNAVGAAAVATPGTLAGWTHMLATARHAPAARGARGPRSASPSGRLHGDELSLRMYRRAWRRISRATPGSRRCSCPAEPRSRPARTLVQADYAATLRRIADDGPATLYRRRARTARRRPHRQRNGGTLIARRSCVLPAARARADPTAAIAAAASSARRRRPRAASTSRRCSTSSKGSTSARWASARPTAIHLLAEIAEDRASRTAPSRPRTRPSSMCRSRA